MRDTIILRVSEIFLKGDNRKYFFRSFIKNARRLVSDLENVEVRAMYLRAEILHPPELKEQCIQRLGRLFGLASMSAAIRVDRSLDAFTEPVLNIARNLPTGSTFKIATKRRDKSFPMTSMEVSRQLGGRVLDATSLTVDVRKPDHTIRVEIGEEDSFVYGAVIPGPGGLPVGTGGKVSLLLSGGIDSPVAGYSAMRRGCMIDAVYFHSFPYTGDKTREKVVDLTRKLAAFQGRIVLHVVHFTDVQKQLREHGKPELAVLLYRRMMVRAACKIADRERSRALLTGENLGQVASQTLENLAVIQAASSLPILRPLLTFDKRDIIDLATRIDTFETSILPYDDCCALFVPKHPATRARLKDLLRSEAGLDVDAMAQGLADKAEREVIS